jgi:D-3-phosphoglycerate dehydrogenase
MKQINFFIDFDSTFIQAETMEVIADVVLHDHPDKEEILEMIISITNQGMSGVIGFDESLKQRLALLKITKEELGKAVEILEEKISPSVKRNKEFFNTFKDNIYIISGGFKECISPIVEEFGLQEKNIFANTFIFNNDGEVIGVDEANDLCQKNGKVKAVQKINPDGEIFVIGDGYTDYQIKECFPHARFIAYTETVSRENVTQKADYVVSNFDEFFLIFNIS